MAFPTPREVEREPRSTHPFIAGIISKPWKAAANTCSLTDPLRVLIMLLPGVELEVRASTSE